MLRSILDTVPQEELRFAVVLNGGVSLAVWMGGVALELQRITRSDPGGTQSTHPYGPVLALTNTRAVADIISGTSAGGINGAALALAEINPAADLTALRGLWSDSGRMEELLRQPFKGDPTSLLRGDEYFLPELGRAMKSLLHDFPTVSTSTTPTVDLSIATTLVTGAQRVSRDDFGRDLPQELHAATFDFTLNPAAVASHIGSGSVGGAELVAAELALAARASASFPFAFEPAFIPIGPAAENLENGFPDMTSRASWAKAPTIVGDRTSRFAVDGGVLANTPTRYALRKIDGRLASVPVRRVMLLVFPHAPDVERLEVGDQTRPPTTVEALTGVLGAMRAEGSRTFVDEVEQHNERATAWREVRTQIIKDSASGLQSLYERLESSWTFYRELRKTQAAHDFAEKRETEGLPAGWSKREVRRAFLTADTTDVVPYVPSVPPWSPRVSNLSVFGSPNEWGWGWGFTSALAVADAAADFVRIALAAAPRAGETAARLGDLFESLLASRESIKDLRAQVDEPWASDLQARRNPDVRYWVERINAYTASLHGGSNGVGTQLQVAVLKTVICMRDALDLLDESPVLRDAAAVEGSSLGAWRAFLVARSVGSESNLDPHARTLMRLLALDAATWLYGQGPAGAIELPISLTQLSLKETHSWAVQSTAPADKAAGMKLGHFGGFLMRSWRVNDWTWGRLDAARMLCRISLDDERLQRIGRARGAADPAVLAAAVLDEMVSELVDGQAVPPSFAALLASRRARAVSWLGSALSGAEQDVVPGEQAGSVEDLIDVLVYPIQARIMFDELPHLVAAIKADIREGASIQGRGQRFLDAHDVLIGQYRNPDADNDWFRLGSLALAAFDDAGLGRENLADQAGSDLLISTTTKAAGAIVTAATGKNAGLGLLDKISPTVRGAARIPYGVMAGLTSGSRGARAAVGLALAVGGFLLGATLVGINDWSGPWGGAVGAGIAVGALAFTALRTGDLTHSVILVGPLTPLIAYGVKRQENDSLPHGIGLTGVFALALALWIMGRIPWPLASPRALIGDALRKRGGRAVRGGGGDLVVMVLLILALPVRELGRSRGLTGADVRDAWPIGAVLAVVLAALWWTHVRSKQLRCWHRNGVTGYRWRRVANSAGVATAWSWLYGVLLLIAAAILASARNISANDDHWKGEWDWQRITVVVWAVGGAALVLLGPFLLPRRAYHEVEAKLKSLNLPRPTSKEATEQLFRDQLLKFDMAHQRYLHAVDKLGTHDARDLKISFHGRLLLNRVFGRQVQ